MQLFFDLDGTLTNPARGITRCIAHALEQLGRPVPELAALERFIGPPLAQTFSELLGTEDGELVDEAIARYRDRFGEIGLFENEVHDGMPALLDELVTAGHALRIVTSKPTIYAERIAAHFDLSRHFLGVHGSELSGKRCDKAELIAHVLDSEALAGQDCTMIGDRFHDIVGARAHGLRSVGVLWGFGTLSELQEAVADEVACDVHDLRRILTAPAREAS